MVGCESGWRRLVGNWLPSSLSSQFKLVQAVKKLVQVSNYKEVG